jgi:predicted transcriptional regulator
MGMGEEGKDYSPHLCLLVCHHPMAPAICRKQREIQNVMPGRVTVEKRLKRAGATPLFLRLSRPKVLRGRSRPRRNWRRPFFHGAESEQAEFNVRFIKTRVQKRRERMAILKSSPKAPKNETLQIRVEESIRSKLAKYAEFIDSSESYVVSEALKLVFKKGDEFKNWLEDANHNGHLADDDGGSLLENTKKA